MCVSVCLCGKAQIYSMHSCKVPHVHLLHSSFSCSWAPTALSVTLSRTAQIFACAHCRLSKSALSEKIMSFFFTSRPLCSRHDGSVQIRGQWWIKPSKLLCHRLGVCADEVSVDAKGLFVHDALCYGKLLYAYGEKYMWDINLCFSFSSIFRELCARKVFCMCKDTWNNVHNPYYFHNVILAIVNWL